MTTPPLVTVAGVRLTKAGKVILDGIDLTITAGELVAVTGPTNSGKTTLLHLLAGIEQPDDGTISWMQKTPPRWADVGLIPQSIALIDELTVGENVDFAHRAAGAKQATVTIELLESLGLDRLRDRLVSEISVGERQRTMVARALTSSAGLLLADEPTAHQDQHHAGAVIIAIRNAATNGRAAVIATRDPANLINLADRTIPLTHGRVT